MSSTCTIAPSDKKEYLTEIGKILVEENGKKKFYKPVEIKTAHRKSNYYNGADFSCWAMCTFSSHEDFDNYHSQTGEICNYAEMKTEMLQGLSISNGIDLLDFPDVDIDASWLDFGEEFGSIFEGIGDFIFAIFD